MFLKINNLYKSYGKKHKILKDVSLSLKEGECLGLVGESGSGKSTLSRLILGLEDPDRGSIEIEGLKVREWIKLNRGKMSVVFQDYTSSANPSFKVKDIIAEPLLATGYKKQELGEKIDALLKKVNLPLELKERYPHELSGGQLQRVCIARSVSTEPRFIVLDEAISSLDTSVQSQILDLLIDLKKEYGITYLFITHDLQIVPSLCDKIVFLYQGEIVEETGCRVLRHTENEYAKKLLSSIISFRRISSPI